MDKQGAGSGGSRGTLSSPGIDVATAPFTALGPMLNTESPELTLRLSFPDGADVRLKPVGEPGPASIAMT